MKKFTLVFCLSVLAMIFCGFTQSEAAQVYKERTSVTFHNASPYYVVDEMWIQGKHNAEFRDGNLFVTVEDFRDAFNADISYNYDNLTVTLRNYDTIIQQTLGKDTLYVNGMAYKIPASYISSAGYQPVMIALEPFASTIGYKGKFEKKASYGPGEMTLTMPKVPYTLTHVEVNQAAQLVTVYGISPDGITEPLKYMLCSTGAGNCTPNGTYRINPLGTNWYYFPSSNCYIRYCSQITGNICFHSLMFSAQNHSTLSRTAYAAIGTKASHGCIRLFVDDAKFIHQNCGSLPVTISAGYTSPTTDAIRARIISQKPSYEEYVRLLG